ncbi:hypothetical protein GCM10025762_61020 [Haloechinothrix salitolerans]
MLWPLTAGQRVHGASELEGTGALEVFQLEQALSVADLRAQQRCVPDVAVDAGSGGIDVDSGGDSHETQSAEPGTRGAVPGDSRQGRSGLAAA